MGRIPVIVRLQLPDRTIWVPARAIRWTSTHVMVMLTPDENTTSHETSEWLRAQDVVRCIPDDVLPAGWPQAPTNTPDSAPPTRQGP